MEKRNTKDQDPSKVYDTMEAKVAAIEAELREWDADPDWVRRLVG